MPHIPWKMNALVLPFLVLRRSLWRRRRERRRPTVADILARRQAQDVAPVVANPVPRRQRQRHMEVIQGMGCIGQHMGSRYSCGGSKWHYQQLQHLRAIGVVLEGGPGGWLRLFW
jgi:predicted class III extradiol MEMO1 family dioxygenase